MKQPTLFEGVSVALIASIGATVLFTALGAILPVEAVVKLLIALFSLGYISYLLSRSRECLGRVTLVAGWSLVAAVIWLFSPSLAIYGLTHLVMIWLVRALYYYNSLLSALADLGLNAIAVAAAAWAAYQTESLLITTWCFFLAQALFVYIPPRLFRKEARAAGSSINEDLFQQSHRAAETALQKLSTTHYRPGDSS